MSCCFIHFLSGIANQKFSRGQFFLWLTRKYACRSFLLDSFELKHFVTNNHHPIQAKFYWKFLLCYKRRMMQTKQLGFQQLLSCTWQNCNTFKIFLPAHDFGKTTPSARSLPVSLNCQQHQLSLHNWTHLPQYSPTVTLIQMCMIGLCIHGKKKLYCGLCIHGKKKALLSINNS